MNKPQQLLSCLALSLALSVIALDAWHKGLIKIDSNAVYYCLINSTGANVYGTRARRSTAQGAISQGTFSEGAFFQGTRVSLQLNQTTIVWMQCAGN